AEMEALAVPVSQYLDRDVASVLDEFLAVHLGRAERGAGLRLAGVERLDDLPPLRDDAHPAPAAAGRGLEDERVADPLGGLERLGGVLQRSLTAGNDGHARLHRDLARLGLVAHHPP